MLWFLEFYSVISRRLYTIPFVISFKEYIIHIKFIALDGSHHPIFLVTK